MKLQKIIAIFGILVFIAFTPVVSLVFTGMSILGMTLGIMIFLFGVFMPRVLGYLKEHKLIRAFIIAILVICILWALICSVLLISASARKPENSDTVIVLGCQIKGTRPSKMLKQRLDKAYDYLTENPDAVAIMSGGQGPDEVTSEAEVMYNYLIGRGVDPERLFIEPESHNTEQNMLYSADIINREGLDRDVVVITQAFHQYRASVYAERAGLDTCAINCKTNPGTLPTYWLRELFAIVKMILVK